MKALNLILAIATACMVFVCLTADIPQQTSAYALAIINGILSAIYTIGFVINK